MTYDIPFVPSSDEKLLVMLELSGVKPGMKTLDLGSGDGKVVIAMAKKGAEAHGYEIDPGRVRVSRITIDQEGLDGTAQIHEGSFWDAEIGDYDIITLFGITSVMERLEDKLKREMKPNGIVVSNLFTFPNWIPIDQRDSVYVYMNAKG